MENIGYFGRWERDGIQSKEADNRVKLAINTETGDKVAIKIMNKEDAEGHAGYDINLFVTLMNNEVEAMNNLPHHDNIIKLIEFNWKG